MIAGATLLAALAIWGLGALVLGLTGRLDRDAEPRTRLESVSLAVLVGASLWAALWMLVGLATPVAAVGRGAGLGLAVVAALAGAVVTWRARAAAAPLESPRWTFAERLGLGLALFFAGFSVFYASTMPVHIFDPVFHFAYKGKLLFHEGLMQAGWTDVEGPLGRVITHPDYPPGVGALEAFVSLLGGHFSADTARPLLALFALATGGLLFARLRSVSRRAAICGSLLWLASPFLFYSRLPHSNWLKGAYGLFFGPASGEARFGVTRGPKGPLPGEWSMPDGWTLDGAGDLPLAALFSAGALLLFGALASRDRSAPRRADLVLAGILLGGGALMKNEGLALLPVALLAAALGWLLSERGKRPRPGAALGSLAGALGLALVVAGPWLAVRSSVPTIGEDYPSRLTPAGFVEAATSTQSVRISQITGELEQQAVPRIVVDGFAAAFANVPRFGGLWLLFFGALGFGLLRPRQRLRGEVAAAALAVLGASLLYALVLVVTPWNLDALFKTAIPDRLIFHVAPLAIFALVRVLECAEVTEPGTAASPLAGASSR